MMDELDSLVRLHKSTMQPIVTGPASPARSAYIKLRESIAEFEQDLDDDHEVGARLVASGQVVALYLERLGYCDADMLTFHGRDEAGQKVQLIQHVSQLSVLLVAMQKQHEVPRRISFIVHRKEPHVEAQ